MKIDITYPVRSKKAVRVKTLRRAVKMLTLLAAATCVIVNLCTGGKAWSVVALFGMYVFWTFVISPDMLEYNRVNQISKLAICASVMVLLIGVLLSPGWAITVVPIVCFSGLIIVAILFFTDYRRQRQNAMPMIWMIVLYLISTVVTLSVWNDNIGWTTIVMGSVSLALFLACVMIMRKDLWRELKKHFHTR